MQWFPHVTSTLRCCYPGHQDAPAKWQNVDAIQGKVWPGQLEYVGEYACDVHKSFSLRKEGNKGATNDSITEALRLKEVVNSI